MSVKPHTSMTAPRFLTVDNVAMRLQVSGKTVRRWIASGALPAYDLGGQYRISEADLAAFMAARRSV